MTVLHTLQVPDEPAKKRARRDVVGIDLGTSNSLVATVIDGRPQVIEDAEGGRIVPSVVRYGPEGVQVGAAARAALADHPDEVVASVKRLMGRGQEEVSDDYSFDYASSRTMAKLRAGGRELSPVEISADILKHLVNIAEKHFAKAPSAAVITVPAYFDDSQRQATKDAARLAGLEVLRLVNEPTAAALAYGLDKSPEGVYVVYDLGGGTFDVSVLRLRRGVFEVLATAGDTALGGDDYDRALADCALAKAGLQRPAGAQRRILLAAARVAKEKLTAETSVTLAHEGQQIEVERDEFINATQELTDRTLEIVKGCLADSGASGEVRGVIMVGGSVRMPQIAAAVAKLLDVPQHDSIDSDEVVALGAAAQADILAGNRAEEGGWVLLDVTPLSLGIETMGGLVEKIIPRNSAIPIARSQEFTTHQDGQGAMSIHVLQGERELARDCRSLARFTLRDLPPLPAGTARIRVTYQADADGIVTVEAQEQTTGRRAAVEVKPSYGLQEEEIAAMLSEAAKHARSDADARALIGIRTTAKKSEQLIRDMIRMDSKLVSNDKEKIEKALERLSKAIEGDSAGEILKLHMDLNDACQGFFQRRLGAAMARAIDQGRSLDELG